MHQGRMVHVKRPCDLTAEDCALAGLPRVTLAPPQVAPTPSAMVSGGAQVAETGWTDTDQAKLTTAGSQSGGEDGSSMWTSGGETSRGTLTQGSFDSDNNTCTTFASEEKDEEEGRLTATERREVRDTHKLIRMASRCADLFLRSPCVCAPTNRVVGWTREPACTASVHLCSWTRCHGLRLCLPAPHAAVSECERLVVVSVDKFQQLCCGCSLWWCVDWGRRCADVDSHERLVPGGASCARGL